MSTKAFLGSLGVAQRDVEDLLGRAKQGVVKGLARDFTHGDGPNFGHESEAHHT